MRKLNKAFWCVFRLNMQVIYRTGGTTITTLLFFITVVSLSPFGFGPDMVMLAITGPALIWIGALLATLLTMDSLFQSDEADGTLEALLAADRAIPIELIVLAKCLSHWLSNAVPLVSSIPLIALLVNIDLATVLASMLALLAGTLVLTLIGSIGAALEVTSRCGNVLMAVLVMPFTIPVLVFGISASLSASVEHASFSSSFLILLSFGIVSLVIAPFAAAALLRISNE